MTTKPAKPKIPNPPKSLGADGRAYWRKIMSDFVVEDHHLDLLRACCEQLDRAAAARAVIAEKGVTTEDRFGQVRTHPAVDSERAAHLAFCRLQRELGLDVLPPSSRGPTRPGTRS
jgi:P27 family predicted phage terminase small subunit